MLLKCDNHVDVAATHLMDATEPFGIDDEPAELEPEQEPEPAAGEGNGSVYLRVLPLVFGVVRLFRRGRSRRADWCHFCLRLRLCLRPGFLARSLESLLALWGLTIHTLHKQSAAACDLSVDSERLEIFAGTPRRNLRQRSLSSPE